MFRTKKCASAILMLVTSLFQLGLLAQEVKPCSDCILQGQVGAQLPGRGFVPATNSKVYILYQSEFVNHGMRDRHFTHEYSFYSAGGQFHGHYVEGVSEDQELKPLVQKLKKKPPLSDDEAIRFSDRSIQHVDQAIASVMDWKSKHAKEAWQVKEVTPDEKGNWITDPLPPGTYQVVARGTVSQLDCDWIFEIDLEPDIKQRSPLRSVPEFYRPIQR